jgi:hypothetical protein
MGTMNVKCETTRAPAIEETLITVQNEEADDSDSSTRFASPVNAPDSKGDFLIRGLPPGRYLLDNRRFMDETWYVRGVGSRPDQQPGECKSRWHQRQVGSADQWD